MLNFRFPLEKVLRWRNVQLAAEESKLKRVLEEQHRLQTAAAELGAEKSKLLSSLTTIPDLGGDDLRAASTFSLRLKRLSEKLAVQLATCDRDLGIRRTKYQAAKRRVQLLEQLKERQLADWRYNETRELETLASESYLAKFNRDRA